MTSYLEILAVKKLIKMRFFTIKIHHISSQNDPNITYTKNYILGLSHKDMAIKINFVLFERTFKVIFDVFRTFAWFLKYFDQKQCAVRHLGIIIA